MQQPGVTTSFWSERIICSGMQCLHTKFDRVLHGPWRCPLGAGNGVLQFEPGLHIPVEAPLIAGWQAGTLHHVQHQQCAVWQCACPLP